ncbi:TPA: hypothetical protein U2L25_003980, partial [Burkholderia multivorans]|nr:hypothetical protein [Burkholderia multivorans]
PPPEQAGVFALAAAETRRSNPLPVSSASHAREMRENDRVIRHDRLLSGVSFSNRFPAQTMIRKIGKNLPGTTADSFSPIFYAPSDR